MLSLTTPVTPTPFGTCINGTAKPYRKVIYDVTVDPWVDGVTVSLALGCLEDEDWTDEEKYLINHEDLETWMEKNDKLSGDDTRITASYNGDPMEIGGPYTVAYVDHIRSLECIPDVIEYMKAKKIIPDYAVGETITIQ